MNATTYTIESVHGLKQTFAVDPNGRQPIVPLASPKTQLAIEGPVDNTVGDPKDQPHRPGRDR